MLYLDSSILLIKNQIIKKCDFSYPKIEAIKNNGYENRKYGLILNLTYVKKNVQYACC